MAPAGPRPVAPGPWPPALAHPVVRGVLLGHPEEGLERSLSPFAPRLVLIRQVLCAGACHQLHVGGTVYLGSRRDTRGAGGSGPVPHTRPLQHRTQVLLSPETDDISLPTVEVAGSEPWGVTNERKTVLVSSWYLGWGPRLGAHAVGDPYMLGRGWVLRSH